jgi:hypothetical protein
VTARYDPSSSTRAYPIHPSLTLLEAGQGLEQGGVRARADVRGQTPRCVSFPRAAAAKILNSKSNTLTRNTIDRHHARRRARRGSSIDVSNGEKTRGARVGDREEERRDRTRPSATAQRTRRTLPEKKLTKPREGGSDQEERVHPWLPGRPTRVCIRQARRVDQALLSISTWSIHFDSCVPSVL